MELKWVLGDNQDVSNERMEKVYVEGEDKDKKITELGGRICQFKTELIKRGFDLIINQRV